jgi:hypothetical protein
MFVGPAVRGSIIRGVRGARASPGCSVLAVKDRVALLDLGSDPLSVLADAAWADCDHPPLLGLLLCRVRDDDFALQLLLGIERLDEHPIAQGLDRVRGDWAPTPPGGPQR